ncbi:hypothetical protein F0562_018332 [Nyssa sinensis]|uniref:Sinapine esterase n=1 Tax=Nyssa sinensis TaxID=561372 RepID=A0A5J4Z8W0_9ASTE|nr:hypothetical protein F0562_018332 [Nyssa sinensis]
MASPSLHFFLHILSTLTISTQYAIGCYTSVFSFGDSLADTGNLLHFSQSGQLPHFGLPPYGETYFHHPTGRCSNGRLITDFIAHYLGLPFIPPYFGFKNGSVAADSGVGVNFAVVGATALDYAFFQQRGIHNPYTKTSLRTQLSWFKNMLPSLSLTSSNCKKLLQSSLVLMGEIGGNDYNHAFLTGRSIEEIQSFVPLVVNVIASTINELIKLGATTLMVPGNLPIGCSAAYLTYFKSSNKEDYDPRSGCLIWLNKFAEYHNDQLQTKLNRIRKLHPRATIIYADYYNAAMRFYHSPRKFGFTGGALTACCGAGGPYNYNSSMECGYPPASACDDPSLYVSWDGLHLTEAAYRWITKGHKGKRKETGKNPTRKTRKYKGDESLQRLSTHHKKKNHSSYVPLSANSGVPVRGSSSPTKADLDSDDLGNFSEHHFNRATFFLNSL